MDPVEVRYDSLDAHLALADDMAAASVPMGMLLAWCVNMQLISEPILQEHERLILRLRFEEASGSELLIACGGDLSRDMFNAQGQQFLDQFYPAFMPLFRDLFGADCYAVRDNWVNYRKLAEALTRKYMGAAQPKGDATQGSGMLQKITRWLKR